MCTVSNISDEPLPHLPARQIKMNYDESRLSNSNPAIANPAHSNPALCRTAETDCTIIEIRALPPKLGVKRCRCVPLNDFTGGISTKNAFFQVAPANLIKIDPVLIPAPLVCPTDVGRRSCEIRAILIRSLRGAVPSISAGRLSWSVADRLDRYAADGPPAPAAPLSARS